MIYLDYNATTPCDSRVIKSMQPYFSKDFGNPASDHACGLVAKNAVEAARKTIAKFIGAKQREIIFTSCATESNNLALIGLATKHKNSKNHIITTRVEHSSILKPCKYLESLGYEVTYLDVDQEGFIDMEQLKNSIRKDTLVVSILFANNEIGTIQDIKKISESCGEKSVYFHTDAAQAVGHIPVDVDEMNIDMMSVSAHKFGGPKGIGVLFLRDRVPRVSITPLLYGGGQERLMRSGTLNVPLIVGMSCACSIASEEILKENERFRRIMNRLFEALKGINEDIKLNGHPIHRLSHNLNIEIPGIDNQLLKLKMKDFCFSTGSACSEFHNEPSHVLLAIGLNKDRTNNCIRISIGKETREDEIDLFIDRFSEVFQAKNKIRGF